MTRSSNMVQEIKIIYKPCVTGVAKTNNLRFLGYKLRIDS